jgi:hypothetical protein
MSFLTNHLTSHVVRAKQTAKEKMEENFDILRALMDVQGQDKVSNEYLLHILHLIDVPAAQKHDLDMLKRSYEMEIKCMNVCVCGTVFNNSHFLVIEFMIL